MLGIPPRTIHELVAASRFSRNARRKSVRRGRRASAIQTAWFCEAWGAGSLECRHAAPDVENEMPQRMPPPALWFWRAAPAATFHTTDRRSAGGRYASDARGFDASDRSLGDTR